LDNAAEEGSDGGGEDNSESDEENKIKHGKHHENQRYNEDDLKRKNRVLDDGFFDQLGKKFESTVRPDDEISEGSEWQDSRIENPADDKNLKKGLLPSVKDPRLWQVKVKKG
jgi:hypothetical protein